MKIDKWLDNATQQLRATEVNSPRLDAELILAHSLKKSREWLLAHGDFALTNNALTAANLLLTRRLNREPIAYILGYREFYGRKFVVTSDVLIPRPETEQLTEIVREVFQDLTAKHRKVSRPSSRGDGLFSSPQSLLMAQPPQLNSKKPSILDLGTGSGAIAITLALELPNTEITASDISDKALAVAKQNAERLGATVEFVKSDLLQNICNKQFDIIVTNLPYVDPAWETSPEIVHEPETALFATDSGLELVKKLIEQSPNHLTMNGLLVLELDPRQIKTVKKIAEKHGFKAIDENLFALTLCRQTTAKHK